MNITTTVDGSTTIIALEGWLDTNTSPELGAALQDLDDGCESLVLDLVNLEYISSAGLRVLVSAHKQMKGNLTIRNVSAEVMQVLHMAGFDRRLHIE